MKKILPIITITIILIVTGLLYKKYKTVPQLPVYNSILINEMGKPFKIAEFKGHYILVSYFQTWCGDCIRELSTIDALQTAVGKENIKIIMISDEPFEKIMRFKEKYCNTLDYYHSPLKLNEQNIRVFPTTYLLNRKGEVIISKLNAFDWSSEEVLTKIN